MGRRIQLGETPSEFVQRRGREAGALAVATSLWSLRAPDRVGGSSHQRETCEELASAAFEVARP